MADVIGILSFALHAAHKVYDIVQTLKDAPDAARALGKEASRVKGLLTVMLPQPNGEPSPLLRNDGNPLVKALVDDATELETAVEALFAKAVKRKEDGTHAVRKSRWNFLRWRGREALCSIPGILWRSYSGVCGGHLVRIYVLDAIHGLIVPAAPVWMSSVPVRKLFYQINTSIIASRSQVRTICCA